MGQFFGPVLKSLDALCHSIHWTERFVHSVPPSLNRSCASKGRKLLLFPLSGYRRIIPVPEEELVDVGSDAENCVVDVVGARVDEGDDDPDVVSPEASAAVV